MPSQTRLLRSPFLFFALLLAALVLAVAFGAAPLARADGSVQVGTNQPLDGGISGNLTFYVDILAAGEVINISLSGGGYKLYEPSGAERVGSGPGGQLTNCSTQLAAPITTASKFITDQVGQWKIVLNPTSYTCFDISVTPDAGVDPDPRVASGRVFSYDWGFGTGSFAESAATDGDYYILVPGGRDNTNYVWLLDLNKFSGNVYNIAANDLGLNPPYSGYSAESASSTYTPLFPIYLGYPAVADPPPTVPPAVSSLRFIDSDGQDNGITPGSSPGVQDSGTFEFTTDVTGTYGIVIDTNEDGQYAAGDRLLLGRTVNGFNQVSWDGEGPGGASLALGTYNAQLSVRIGEYHFIAEDAETSGGTYPGLTVHQAITGSPVPTTTTRVYWDDLTYLAGTTTLPDGAMSDTPAGRHTWGDFTSTGFGNERNIDTYVYGLVTLGTTQVVIAGNDSMDYGDAPASYSTLATNNGARHVITGSLYLGATAPDVDADGQASANADGDDSNGTDDEDGVTFSGDLPRGGTANVAVVASGSGKLNGWVDFNADGDWADAGEQVFTDRDVVAGTNNLSFSVPAGATEGATYTRFRLNSTGSLAYTGPANDGEVEDYRVTIAALPADLVLTKTAKISYLTFITYTVVVRNLGPGPANGAVVSDTMPVQLTDVTWTCAASAGSSCVASGAGNIDETITTFPVGGVVTYTVRSRLVDWNDIENTASVAVPAGITDPTPENNSDTVILYLVDLPIILKNSR